MPGRAGISWALVMTVPLRVAILTGPVLAAFYSPGANILRSTLITPTPPPRGLPPLPTAHP